MYLHSSTLLIPYTFSVNCEWNEWTAWESCSVTCGNGTQKRTRTPYIAAKYGGLECKGLWHKKNDYEYKGCSNDEVCSFTCKKYELIQ